MLNLCQFIGNLGQDPTVRNTQDGSPVVTLSVGVTDTWRDKQSGERRERTEWVKVVLFNEHLCKFAENYLKKGNKVYVSGAMQTRKWADQSGVEKYTTEIVCQKFNGELKNLSPRPKDDFQGGYAPASGSSDFDDEIPF